MLLVGRGEEGEEGEGGGGGRMGIVLGVPFCVKYTFMQMFLSRRDTIECIPRNLPCFEEAGV